MNVFSTPPLTPEEQLIQGIQGVLDRNGLSSWTADVEDSLWLLTRKLPDKETVERMIEGQWKDLTVDDVEQLRKLSDQADGWAHARNEPQFVDKKEWGQIHDPANRLPRYTS